MLSRLWMGSRSRRTFHPSCGLIIPCLACTLFIQSQQPSQTPSAFLSPPGDLTISLNAGQSILYKLELPSGTTTSLRIEQTAGAIELQSSSTGTPRTNPAGLHSEVSETLIANTQGPRIEQINLRNLSKTKSAELVLHIDPRHPTSSADQIESDAETAFATAETIRLQRTATDYPKALQSYDRSIDLWRADTNKLARALAWKALFLFVNQNDPAAAKPFAEEALTHTDSLAPVEAANCFKIAGYVHVQLALYDAGLENYQAAIAIYEQTHDLFNQEVLLDNLSRVERLQGNTAAALAAAQRADSLAGLLGDAVRQLKIKSGIGAIELSAANLQAAYTAYQAALALIKTTPEPTTEGYIWSDLGVLYTLMQEPQQAHLALDQAMEIWKQHPNPPAELNTLDDYGEFWMSQSKRALARVYYLRGLTLARSQSLARPEIFLLRGLGATYLLDGDLPSAQKNLDQALNLALKVDEGDGLPEIYCLLGDLHTRQQDLAAAEEAYGHCRASAIAAKDVYNSIRAAGSMARLRFQQGQLEAAEEFSEKALAGIEATRSTIPEQDLRTSFFASMRSYYELAIDILERLDQLHPQEGYQWSAFSTAERARTRMLLDQLHRNDEVPSTNSSALSAEYAAAEAHLRRQQEALNALSNHVSQVRQQQLRDAIARLTVEVDALATEAAKSSPASPNNPPIAPLTLAKLQSNLPSHHAVFLEFWTGERSSYLFAATRTGFRSFRLPPVSKLKPQIAAFSHLLQAPATQNPLATAEDRARNYPLMERELDRQATALRRELLPLGAIPPGTHSLLLAADGPLTSIPFAALLNSPSSSPPSSPQTSRDIISEPSATFLQELLSRHSPSPQQERIAIFTEASETMDLPAASSKSTPDRNNSTGELPFVLDEASSIRNIFGQSNSKVFSGTSASPAAIKNFQWESYTIGHFAAHATLNHANLQLSGIRLNSSTLPGDPDASTLWYGDVCRLHTQLELVVLSACNTANGVSIPGEGLVGLTQAFFTAGTQRVLGSLWPVDDEATSALMKYFYTSLRSTHSPATALRVAQSRMAATQRWHLPYYWAGFSLAGDWRSLP